MRLAARVVMGLLLVSAELLFSQNAHTAGKANNLTVSELEQSFFATLRNGDALQFLSYVPEDGVNLGRDAEHASKSEIEDQLTKKTQLYCKLFDSSCLHATAESRVPSCSYRELLNDSQKIRTAATETTRNNVHQAILIAEVQNDKCGGHLLIDFIFNRQQGAWKLFSIP